ncbi:Choline dehydrogenase [Erythrobacter litoralis]|jgi:choline dehydrogenase-like flavoprotein|uniref:Glucose-methanol-choline oxidoreductase n=1 Tax=Erythrobacter litoralis TaxID=39960 RepID=A0A074MC76_9SPHN|nr:GMC family oxidoreductase N-terminal domain-containing protein [Erythrobacter litoralis]AOL22206.1 Choline dehydrogenase [Erythrobacter litoralis]KEO91044.1 glucose-methanol-choline oxidoreductase [Erythrobacter litoralis]MEE4337468.1 GMC family oxidoreductase N-terminal domain-containing protein [Erythrobacter sp.]
METFDYIVIGGGSGGSAVAGRLAVDGTRRVCLLEAGGRNDNIFVKTPGFMPFIPQASNYRYETVPQKGLNGRIGYQPRGKGLGGSSAINAMVYIRGNRWDYDNWAGMGCTGWAYDDVLPYFRRSESNERGEDAYHGAGGPLFVSDQVSPNPTSEAFVESAAALQLRTNDDFNGERQEGFGLYQTTQRKGERWSAARGYVEPIRHQGNFAVRTNTLVDKLEIEGGRVTGVRVRRGGRSEMLYARRGVILSAGAFNSPQILMLSGIGPAEHLKQHGIEVVLDRSAVGANLQDHIDYVSGWETQSDVPLGGSLKGTLKMLGAMVEHRRKRTGAMTTCYAEAGGFWTVMPDSPAPDVQWHFVPAVLEDHGREKVKEHGFSLHACVLRPESRGTVRLGSKDSAAAPVIDPNFLDDERDMAVLRAGVRLSHRIAEAPPLTDYGPRDRHPIDLEDDAALDALIRDRADTVYHPVGTCRMGSDADAVVDPTLKLNGLDGLWIADASIMPKIVSGNTNAPSIVIGERCADFIKAAEAA